MKDIEKKAAELKDEAAECVAGGAYIQGKKEDSGMRYDVIKKVPELSEDILDRVSGGTDSGDGGTIEFPKVDPDPNFGDVVDEVKCWDGQI